MGETEKGVVEPAVVAASPAHQPLPVGPQPGVKYPIQEQTLFGWGTVLDNVLYFESNYKQLPVPYLGAGLRFRDSFYALGWT
jgi:hypothetical protein